MKAIQLTTKLLLMMAMFSMAVMSCRPTEEDDNVTITENIVVKGIINTNTTWKATNKYTLEGFVYVDAGATLTIEPGTVIFGDKVTKGALIVKPGAKIIADGLPAKPIVFTSSQPKGSRNYGDWGGLVVLGKGVVNKSPATIEGENVSTFGGTEAADNSGIIRYVRIEFAGIAFETDKEINGLTLGGVGSGTTIDFVQVSNTGDDAFEWFGGNVNAKHLVSYRNLDDDFDTDWGYSGNVQYALAIRDPKVADQCTCSDSNGFESDNDGSGSGATPQTSAKFANVSVFMGDNGTPDAKFRSALRLRRNSALSVYNSVFTGAFPKGGLELGDDPTKANLVSGKSDFKGLMFADMTKGLVAGDTTILYSAARKNVFNAKVADLGLPTGYNAVTTKPSFLIGATSKLKGAGATLPSGFEATDYVGAFLTTDWTQGWTNWDPQNTDY